MLGTRTKQVFTYGRRGHRIVNASDERGQGKPSRTTKLPAVENMTHSDSSSDSDYTPSTTKHLNPTMTAQPVKHKAPKKKTIPASAISPKAAKLTSNTITTRRPLSAQSNNVPHSPAVKSIRKRMKPQVVVNKYVPLKPASPVVKVDIIVLDDTGHTISQERRISRPDVLVNSPEMPPARKSKSTAVAKKPASKPRVTKVVPAKVNKKPAPVPAAKKSFRTEPILISDSDEDEPTPSIVPVGRKLSRPVVLSSGSEISEDDLPVQDASMESISPPKPPKRTVARKVILSSPESDLSSPGASSSNRRLPAPDFPQRNNAPPFKHPQPIPRPAFPVPTRPTYHARDFTPNQAFKSFSLHQTPPSPTPSLSDSDLDLSLDLEELALSPSTRKQIAASFKALETNVPAYLQPLLAECSQKTPHEFSAFIKMFPRDPIVRLSHEGFTLPAFQKIGEASYSEVFGIGDVVLKIVPLRDELKRPSDHVEDLDSPAPSDAKDVLKEIVVTRAMGEICEGFVKLLRAYVVRGRYPSLLLDLWDQYDKVKGSESVRPDSFTASQTYAIIVLPNGGPDLETFTFQPKMGWRQACSIFWQVTRALAEAEELVHFEHRDLHWGQILVNNTEPSLPSHTKGKRVPMDDNSHEVRATIIDLGLSRMGDGSGTDVHWTPFDEEIFEGEGDVQFEVYRMMRMHNGDDWKSYKPLTNVMWLHYLTLKLLKSKKLRAPSVSRKSKSTTSTAVSLEQDCHECLLDLEQILSEAVSGCKPQAAPKKSRRKTHAPSKSTPVVTIGPQNAAQVLQLGKERGWLR
ncbi:hypothetical protein QCA50_020132 [Cerrena zonata]|uniref:non-specific serine/threonine protein kinase n=1 Tax=Cerrena zonata TaxID=2478898 RepID=A0AAW0FHS4_9APHY